MDIFERLEEFEISSGHGTSSDLEQWSDSDSSVHSELPHDTKIPRESESLNNLRISDESRKPPRLEELDQLSELKEADDPEIHSSNRAEIPSEPGALSAPKAISEEYLQCKTSYNQLLRALSFTHCYIVCENLVSRQELTDLYGRFEIWGEQVKVSLPGDLPGSLQDSLRSHEKLEEVIRSALHRVAGLLRKTIPVARVTTRDVSDSEQELIGSTSDDSSSAESETAGNKSRRTPRVTILVRHLFEEIETLYDASSVLRRSKLELIQSKRDLKRTVFYDKAQYGTDIFYPNLPSIPQIKWPTEDNLRQKDRIYLSRHEPGFRIRRLRVEWVTWAPLLKGYYDIQLIDSESNLTQNQLKLAIERHILNRARNITGISEGDRKRLDKLISDVSAMTDWLFQVAYIPLDAPQS